MDYRSPLGNIFNIIGALPQGHDKPVKHALYNAVALLLLFLCCAAGWALFVILEPFIKPLIWALLVGSVLFPLKYSLAKRFRTWFETMEESRTPAFIGLFIIPINIINDLSEFIGSKLLKHIKFIIAVTISVPFLHVIYYYTPKMCICLIWKMTQFSNVLLNFFITNATIAPISFLLVGYASLMYLLWKPDNNKKFHYASIAVWILISLYIANLFGPPLQTPVFVVLQIILLAGFGFEVYDIHEGMKMCGKEISLIESVSMAFQDKSSFDGEQISETEIEKSEACIQEDTDIQLEEKSSVTFLKTPTMNLSKSQDDLPKIKDPWSLDHFESKTNCDKKGTENKELSNATLLITDKGNVHVIKQSPSMGPSVSDSKGSNLHKFKRSHSQPSHSEARIQSQLLRRKQRSTGSISSFSQNIIYPSQYASDFYLYSVLWACGIMLFWKNLMLLPILPIPILIYVVKHAGNYLGVWNWLCRYWNTALDCVNNWCYERYDALVPVPIRGLYKVIHKANINLKKNIKGSIDTVASCVVILALLIFVICASIFIAVQVYTEAIMLVQMTSNVINQTVVQNPEMRQLLPPSWDDTVDSILDNAYQYGREGISKVVKSMLRDVDSEKTEKLEKQVLELWDRVYQVWMSSDTSHGPKVTQSAVQHSWAAFIDDIQKSPEIFNLNGLMEFAKQNVETLLSLLESVWSIVKGNISLVLGSFSAFVSVLFGGGTAVLNFILNLIVFLTTLFYLLNSSGELYKPVELMTNFSSSGSRFGLALEAAVNGVFTASFKMAAFYGMWTWLIHNLFNVKIVYLPSAFGAILGAIPFLGTYWACIPAVLDLWLAQDKGFQAILFATFQVLPMSIVDTTIYKEIRGGGHPYLTGLAIAGGIFCLGVEGAIIGPLLLCGLYVAIDLSSTLFRDTPSEEALNLAPLSRMGLQNA